MKVLFREKEVSFTYLSEVRLGFFPCLFWTREIGAIVVLNFNTPIL